VQHSFRLANLSARHLYRRRTRVRDGRIRGVGDGGLCWGGDRRLLTDHYSCDGYSILTCLWECSHSRHIVLSKRDQKAAAAKLDCSDLGSLSLAIAAMQVFLDRGAQLAGTLLRNSDRGVVCASALTSSSSIPLRQKIPSVKSRLFLDRISLGVSVHLHPSDNLPRSLALLTPYLADLMGYPVVTAGSSWAHGAGHDACMFLVGRLSDGSISGCMLMTGCW